MARGARSVGERLELALFLFLGDFRGADLVELGDCGADAAGFAQNGDFEEAGVDGAGEIGDLFELRKGQRKFGVLGFRDLVRKRRGYHGKSVV